MKTTTTLLLAVATMASVAHADIATKISLDSKIVYDTNLFLESSNETSGLSLRFDPKISFQNSPEAINHWMIRYNPRVAYFVDQTKVNYFDNGATGVFVRQTEKVKLEAVSVWQELTENTFDARTPKSFTNATNWDSKLDLKYGMTAKTTLVFTPEYQVYDYQPANYVDRKVTTLPLEVLYDFSVFNSFGLYFQNRHTDLSHNYASQSDSTYGVMWKTSHSAKLSAELRAGVLRLAGKGELALFGRIAYSPTVKWSLGINGSRDAGTDATGERSIRTALGADATYTFNPTWSATVGADLNRRKYATVDRRNTDEHARVTYTVNRQLTVYTEVMTERMSSGIKSENFNNTRVTLGASFRF